MANRTKRIICAPRRRFRVAQQRRSLVVWITDLAETASTPEVIEAAALLARRHLVLLVVIAQPELRQAPRRGPKI